MVQLAGRLSSLSYTWPESIMIDAYVGMLRNYIAFRGRTSRSAFWSFVLIQGVITAVALILSGVVHEAVGILLMLYLLVTLTPTLAGVVRRLHDTGRGLFWWLPLGVGLSPVAYVLGAAGVQFMGIGFVGWLFASLVDEQEAAEELNDLFGLGITLFGLGMMTGIVGRVLAIILLVFLTTPSERGENKYGPQPEQ